MSTLLFSPDHKSSQCVLLLYGTCAGSAQRLLAGLIVQHRSQLTFDANHLPQCVERLNQISLVCHDFINVFVGSGDLVYHVDILFGVSPSWTDWGD